jgi:hypothetical protein
MFASDETLRKRLSEYNLIKHNQLMEMTFIINAFRKFSYQILNDNLFIIIL